MRICTELFLLLSFTTNLHEVQCAPSKPIKTAGNQRKHDRDLPSTPTTDNGGSQLDVELKYKKAWQVAIEILQGDVYKFRCGGSLISPSVVLTAAHCVHSPDITAETTVVVAGEVDRDLVEGTEQILSVNTIITHPNYTGTLTSLYSHDIAVLRLGSHVTITDSVHPVSSLASEPPGSDLNCFMTGWGSSRDRHLTANELSPTLTAADIGIMSMTECNKRRNWDGLVEQHQLCGYNKKMAACLGDSGGPLVCDVNNTFVQYGVTSWGSKSCDRKPSVFTRVSYYLDWIREEIL